MSSPPVISSGNLYLFNHLLEHIEQLREVHFCRDIIEQIPNVDDRIDAMTKRGHTVKYQRVVFKGGVGSYKFMVKKRVFRLQIAANVRGWDRSTVTIAQGLVIRRKRKQYLAYAWCVEI